MNEYVIVPTHGQEGFVALSRSKKGRVFEKHILSFGELRYPGVAGGKVNIDQSFADTLITNFSNRVCDIVQVPKAGPNNEHTEDPDRNIGEVIGIKVRDNKIYADIDARSEADADKLGKTLLGASAMMHLNYTDTRSGEKVGPTLLHVAVTNRPYIVELEDFNELLAASADGSNDAVLLTATTEETSMDLDAMLASLKAEHNIDVPELQRQAAANVTLSNSLAEQGIIKLSNGESVSAEDIVSVFTDMKEETVALSARVDALTEASTKAAAEARVKGLIRTGHILPKDEEAQVELLLSNEGLFDKLLPETPLVKLSNEQGGETVDETHKETVDDEVERIAAKHVAATK